MDIDAAFIYETTKYKYANPVIKSLPKIITTYVLSHPDEHQRFLSYKLTVKRMITYIKHNLNGNYSDENLIEVILKYVKEDERRID